MDDSDELESQSSAAVNVERLEGSSENDEDEDGDVNHGQDDC